MLALFFIQPVNAENIEDKWKFTIAFPMVWAPDIEGTVEGGGDRIDFTIPFGDIVENLDMGFIGEVFAEKGNWMYALKINYLNAKGETVTDPVLGGIIAPAHRVTNDVQLAVSDLLIGARVHNKIRLYTGVRYIFTTIDLSIRPEDPGGLIAINKDINLVDKSIFDWLVGASFHHQFSNRWGFHINADTAIAGDNDRDYMIDTAFSFRISKLNNIWAGYRYLAIGNDIVSNTSVGSVKYTVDFVQQGPTVGWAFTF